MSGTPVAVESDHVEVGYGESPQRVVVIALLGRPCGRPRTWLYRTSSLSGEAIEEAISKLKQCGVLAASARAIVPSPALVVLDALNMIGV
jgi:hypothetical protein